MDRTDRRLLGRARESEQILDLLSVPGAPRPVLLRGEPGVGRSAFLHATGERLRAQGTPVHAVDCVHGDSDRPLLLVLRLVMAVEKRRPHAEHQPASGPVARALAAVDRGDRAAMETLLRATLARCAPMTVLVDDAQNADPDSLAVLGRIDVPGIGLVVSYAGGAEAATGVEAARTVVLRPLEARDIATLVERRLGAKADSDLAGRVAELTRGVPAAIEALLTGWTDRGAIRVADGHAFVPARTVIPVLPGDDRFVRVVDRLGEPARAVAAALSVLGPLGRPALRLAAAWSGLSTDAVSDGVRCLAEAGVIDAGFSEVLSAAAAVRGCPFRLPLTAHTVRERLSPVDRARLSAMAVEVLWEDANSERAVSVLPSTPDHPDETGALAYRADRIADAGSLVDRERAVAELTSVAHRMRPGPDVGRALRWLRVARDLAERADVRDLVLQQYGATAYLACDHSAGRGAGESLLRDPGPGLSDLDLQEAACLVVVVTANQRDWTTMSRLATAYWWDGLPVPVLAKVTGRALALLHLSRWREAAELLQETEPVWNTGPGARSAPARFKATADLARGRPEPHRHEPAMPDAPEFPRCKVYSPEGDRFDALLTTYDLRAAGTLLETLGLTAHTLPPLARFLFDHCAGRWDQALEVARRLLANAEFRSTPVLDSSLLPARTAGILAARGRLATALQLVADMRGPAGGPPQCALDAAEAELRMTLGDLDEAERTLRGGLATARKHEQVHGTEELWALLAEVTSRAGHIGEATAALDHLTRIATRTSTDRAQLLRLLASARVLRADAPDTARDNLREAVRLARARGLPFETATTLLTAATAEAVPATLLHEAYELFGTTDATLWRHHTRTALRAARLPVPGRAQTTAENDRLLATLIAEGFTNQQIADVLRVNADAVAQRLSRLFARTGLRSRTDVVTAVLTRAL
ncbi:AAA family ATPase [Streptomyces sp. NPDC047042]|uniref:AAA family ATPase n=1 Tax=Streptomyces sp. NPDC047042 TaxID=3154807 RepID=UPI0033C46B56